MAKYVCDFEQVNQIGEKICETAIELENTTNNYSTNIDSDLTEWTGDAKNAFEKSKNEKMTTAKQDYTYMKELGEFIKSAAKKIENLETQISNLSI